jgi:glycerol-3-phosphate dehydrogenase
MLHNAPSICSTQQFVIPCYSFFERLKYFLGLKLYDALSGKYSLGGTKWLSANAIRKALGIQDKRLKGGIAYTDGQFDDAKLAIHLAQTAHKKGATVLNYCKVIALKKYQEKVKGVLVQDVLTGKQYAINAKVVINATGVFVDDIFTMDQANHYAIVAASQGVHIVVDKKWYASTNALMIPKTADGRVLFAVPWLNAVIVGTTDTPVQYITTEPKALQEEIDFIIQHFNQYTGQHITHTDVQAVFAGLRPLVKKQDIKKTSALSRDHIIIVSPSGLVSITGGKWTTYRKMAEDVIYKAATIGGLVQAACTTTQLALLDEVYEQSQKIIAENAELKKQIVPNLHYTYADVVRAIRYEMAQTVEDVLARRTRILFVNARAAKQAAPSVAALLAKELQQNEQWQQLQVASFIQLVDKYYLL